MTKESFSKRLFCNLLGVGSAFSLIIIILQLRFGILSARPPQNETLPTAITFKPPTKVTLKVHRYGGFFRKTFYILTNSAGIFTPSILANGQVCHPTPKPFQEVFALMYFKLGSGTGDLIWLKFLGLKVFMEDWQLCLGEGPYYCSPHRLYRRSNNTLRIGVRDNPDGQTRTVFLILNHKCHEVPSPLPLTQRSPKGLSY